MDIFELDFSEDAFFKEIVFFDDFLEDLIKFKRIFLSSFEISSSALSCFNPAALI